jgi:hypothetical protein
MEKYNPYDQYKGDSDKENSRERDDSEESVTTPKKPNIEESKIPLPKRNEIKISDELDDGAMVYSSNQAKYTQPKKLTQLQRKKLSTTGLQKNDVIEKLKDQNEKLKDELKMLTEKLEEFVQKAKIK